MLHTRAVYIKKKKEKEEISGDNNKPTNFFSSWDFWELHWRFSNTCSRVVEITVLSKNVSFGVLFYYSLLHLRKLLTFKSCFILSYIHCSRKLVFALRVCQLDKTIKYVYLSEYFPWTRRNSWDLKIIVVYRAVLW